MPGNSDTRRTPAKRPLRVGLIGVTGYAYAYYQELGQLVRQGSVEWGAATVINPGQARGQLAFFKRAGVPVYADYREMLEREAARLDWVCIPTAIGWHARMTVESLAMGLPVLLEKPVAPTLQDVDAIQAAERNTGLPVAVGFQHSYSPSTWEIKQLLLDGAIGRIVSVDSICLWPRSRSYYTRNSWSGHLHDGEFWVLDSPLHNALSHLVNLILFLTGPELDRRSDLVSVAAELYRAKPIRNFDTVWTRARLDTGPRASVILSHSSVDTIDPEIRFTGTKGVFVWRFNGGHTLESGGAVRTFPVEEQIPVRQHMFASVVRLLRGDAAVPYCTTELARGEVKWINAVQDAAPVTDVPPACRRQFRDQTGELFDVIDGLEQVALEAHQRGCPFSELKAPWAQPPGQLDLAGYEAFQARHIPPPFPSLEPSVRVACAPAR